MSQTREELHTQVMVAMRTVIGFAEEVRFEMQHSSDKIIREHLEQFVGEAEAAVKSCREFMEYLS